jgi:hypothetical protein
LLNGLEKKEPKVKEKTRKIGCSKYPKVLAEAFITEVH